MAPPNNCMHLFEGGIKKNHICRAALEIISSEVLIQTGKDMHELIQQHCVYLKQLLFPSMYHNFIINSPFIVEICSWP